METESKTYDEELRPRDNKPRTGNWTVNELCDLKTPFYLEPLPYNAKSLEPFIDEETMMVHHDKHHKAYVDKANDAFKAEEIDATELSMKEIFSNIKDYPSAIRNNVGGHFNHTFFWSVLTPDQEKRNMPRRLKDEIDSEFGSFDEFKTEFEKAGVAQFGSGWVWLIRTSSGNLNITTTKNQDNPLMKGIEFDGTPVLAVDVWEHAYYLKYHEKRAEYLKNIWSVINWNQVNDYDLEACKDTQALH